MHYMLMSRRVRMEAPERIPYLALVSRPPILSPYKLVLTYKSVHDAGQNLDYLICAIRGHSDWIIL